MIWCLYEESSQIPVMQECVLLSPSTITSFQVLGCVGRAQLIHFSMGNKHTAELDCFTGEVPHICYNFMDTKFKKLRPGSRQLSKCLLGRTASWDNFGSRSRFMSQLTRGLLGAKASFNICLPLTQWNVWVLETILKRMWMLCTFAFHVIKWFLVS